MPFGIEIGEIIACLALLFSAYSIIKTVRFNKRQNSLIEIQERLNTLLLEKEVNEVNRGKKSVLGANFIKLGSSKYRLKIWNQGKATARNVRIEFPGGNDVFIQSDLDSKFPLESLEQYQSVELIAAISMESNRKQTIKLIWSDDSREYNEKTIYPTI